MDEEINEVDENMIRVDWLKWMFAFGVLCDWCIPTRMKKKILYAAFRPLNGEQNVC